MHCGQLLREQGQRSLRQELHPDGREVAAEGFDPGCMGFPVRRRGIDQQAGRWGSSLAGGGALRGRQEREKAGEIPGGEDNRRAPGRSHQELFVLDKHDELSGICRQKAAFRPQHSRGQAGRGKRCQPLIQHRFANRRHGCRCARSRHTPPEGEMQLVDIVGELLFEGKGTTCRARRRRSSPEALRQRAGRHPPVRDPRCGVRRPALRHLRARRNALARPGGLPRRPPASSPTRPVCAAASAATIQSCGGTEVFIPDRTFAGSVAPVPRRSGRVAADCTRRVLWRQ